MARRILVTGGAGFIGSHTCKLLASSGMQPITYDNLSNGFARNVKWGPLVVGDILDRDRLRETLDSYKPDAVIHFAALAYVGESVTDPERYYRENVQGTLSLLSEMRRAGVGSIVFSSTCATYGVPPTVPILESTEQRPINPYGASKLMVERMLQDFHHAYGLSFAALRYFNACGADPAGELSEDHDPETHLIPRCLQAAAGIIEAVDIFGDDYETADGTCVRDYIHVCDLASGHVAAVNHVLTTSSALKLNLGTGKGLSVREILSGIQDITGRSVPHRIVSRRPGDPPTLFADATAARDVLGFSPRYSDLDTIVTTAWQKYSGSIG